MSAAIPRLSLVGARAAWSGGFGCRLRLAAAAAGVATARGVIANGVANVSWLGEAGSGDSAHEAPVEGPHPPGVFSGRGQRRRGWRDGPDDVCSVFTRARSPARTLQVGHEHLSGPSGRRGQLDKQLRLNCLLQRRCSASISSGLAELVGECAWKTMAIFCSRWHGENRRVRDQ
jgi:hypothetical protein